MEILILVPSHTSIFTSIHLCQLRAVIKMDVGGIMGTIVIMDGSPSLRKTTMESCWLIPSVILVLNVFIIRSSCWTLFRSPCVFLGSWARTFDGGL